MDTHRYEAASTIYGPHTLGAYIQQYTYLTQVACPTRVITHVSHYRLCCKVTSYSVVLLPLICTMTSSHLCPGW